MVVVTVVVTVNKLCRIRIITLYLWHFKNKIQVTVSNPNCIHNRRTFQWTTVCSLTIFCTQNRVLLMCKGRGLWSWWSRLWINMIRFSLDFTIKIIITVSRRTGCGALFHYSRVDVTRREFLPRSILSSRRQYANDRENSRQGNMQKHIAFNAVRTRGVWSIVILSKRVHMFTSFSNVKARLTPKFVASVISKQELNNCCCGRPQRSESRKFTQSNIPPPWRSPSTWAAPDCILYRLTVLCGDIRTKKQLDRFIRRLATVR